MALWICESKGINYILTNVLDIDIEQNNDDHKYRDIDGDINTNINFHIGLEKNGGNL